MASETNLNVKKTKIINRTPSIPVRQTKTSKIRTELGNQLEYFKNNLQKLKDLEAAKQRSEISFKKPISSVNMYRKSVVNRSNEILSRTDSGLRPNSSTKNSPTCNNINIPVKSTQSVPKLQKQNELKVTFNLNKSVASITQLNKNKTAAPVNCKTNVLKTKTKPVITKHTYPVLRPTLKSAVNQIKNEKKTVKIQSPLRKSISAMHLKRVSIRDPTVAIFRSHSAANVSQTIDENITLQLLNFNTPMGKRRSVFNSTPMTLPKNKNLSPWSGCWSPTAQDLKRRLSVWMEKNGKPYKTFENLRCFGMHYLPSEEENKENVVKVQETSSSYEDLKIQITDTDKSDDMSVANEALHDLHTLILEGYPVDQCEAWLDVIRTRFEEMEDEQKYWECMAAIDTARGITETTYKNEHNNDSELESLTQKLNVLNLTPSNCPQSKQIPNFNLDNSNIFKSTEINFAVRQNSIHDDKKFLVTPIKRSTRQSTAGKRTPGIIVCSTLDDSVRKSMHFRTNKALKK